jgi:hypothetical protein
MSAIDSVLGAAKMLADDGKTPSVALLKAKLGNSVALPIIIQGLQRFKAMDGAQQAKILASSSAPQKAEAEITTEEQIASLARQIQQLQAEQQVLKARLSKLENPGE